MVFFAPIRIVFLSFGANNVTFLGDLALWCKCAALRDLMVAEAAQCYGKNHERKKVGGIIRHVRKNDSVTINLMF